METQFGARFSLFEEEGYASGFRRIAGLDEVGRGPLAGPVVAAAVIFPRRFSHTEIKDSKLLTAGQRERLASQIKASAESWALGVAEVEEIDRINILRATYLAMARALQTLAFKPDCLLVDGNRAIPPEMLNAAGCGAGFAPHQRTIIKGDRLCLSIAAASIVAKVARDQMMVELDRLYPQYGFAAHKGYGSTLHLEALRRFGPSPVHRCSFRPVREAAMEPRL